MSKKRRYGSIATISIAWLKLSPMNWKAVAIDWSIPAVTSWMTSWMIPQSDCKTFAPNSRAQISLTISEKRSCMRLPWRSPSVSTAKIPQSIFIMNQKQNPDWGHTISPFRAAKKRRCKCGFPVWEICGKRLVRQSFQQGTRHCFRSSDNHEAEKS